MLRVTIDVCGDGCEIFDVDAVNFDNESPSHCYRPWLDLLRGGRVVESLPLDALEYLEIRRAPPRAR